jgi:hypothetical protein
VPEETVFRRARAWELYYHLTDAVGRHVTEMLLADLLTDGSLQTVRIDEMDADQLDAFITIFEAELERGFDAGQMIP